MSLPSGDEHRNAAAVERVLAHSAAEGRIRDPEESLAEHACKLSFV